MLNRNKIESLLAEGGVVKEGHFLLTSGLHSQYYFEKFRLLERPELLTPFCEELSQSLENLEFDGVCGPTTGGIIIAYEVARLLGKRCLFAEKTENGRDFLRGQQIREDESFVVVDDVLTTGGSIRVSIEALKRRGGRTVAVGVLIDRSEKSPDFESSVPLYSVYKHPVTNYSPTECPLCEKGVSLSRPGGKK